MADKLLSIASYFGKTFIKGSQTRSLCHMLRYKQRAVRLPDIWAKLSSSLSFKPDISKTLLFF